LGQVEFKNLGKAFRKDQWVIRGLALTIQDGEFCVLLGPSGCGKSTILRMIAGLEEITEGEILIDGKTVNKVASKDRDIAMVFQNYALYPHKTVYQNIEYPLKLRKVSKAERRQKVQEAAETLEISHLLDRYPRQLSGGQRQRVAVGRALVRQPKLYLFDEPLSNLDASLRQSMRKELKLLQKNLGITFLYVTHDQVEAMTMADKIVLLREGAVAQVDSPEDLYNHPNSVFVGAFVGNPSMNFASVSKEKNFALGTYEIKLKNADRYDSIIAGIRPEHLSFDRGTSTCQIECEIQLMEVIGKEYQYYLKPSGLEVLSASFVVVTAERIRYAEESPVKVYFKPEDVHLFSPDDKRLIEDS
jgi:multiple sugar transport system ATP-binding protein